MSANPSISPFVDRLLARFDNHEEAIALVTDLIVFIASADTVIDQKETQALVESLETMLESHIAPRVVRAVVDESRLHIRRLGADNAAESMGRKLAEHGAAEGGVRLAAFVAAVSEGISDVERARIDRIANAAGISPARLEELLIDPLTF